jgi:hypothetical protein
MHKKVNINQNIKQNVNQNEQSKTPKEYQLAKMRTIPASNSSFTDRKQLPDI